MAAGDPIVPMPSIRVFGCAFAAVLPMALAGPAAAQEKAQKGVSVGEIERRSQVQPSGADALSIQRDLKQRQLREGGAAALSPQALTDLFLRLDRDEDLHLSRSELMRLPALRARFAQYDLDHDHRLSYSEFADYADVAANELARLVP
jgi:hypothetical protein